MKCHMIFKMKFQPGKFAGWNCASSFFAQMNELTCKSVLQERDFWERFYTRRLKEEFKKKKNTDRLIMACFGVKKGGMNPRH